MECAICLSKMEKMFSIKTPCEHEFCLKCFLKCNNTICPLCRKDYFKKLPSVLKCHFTNKEKIAAINLRSVPDLNDDYEFPPLGN